MPNKCASGYHNEFPSLNGRCTISMSETCCYLFCAENIIRPDLAFIAHGAPGVVR